MGFRCVDGFAERVVYREFFPRGLTALDDLDEPTLGARPNMSHLTAREEVIGLLNMLHLPLSENGKRRAAARAEWYSVMDQPLQVHDVIARLTGRQAIICTRTARASPLRGRPAREHAPVMDLASGIHPMSQRPPRPSPGAGLVAAGDRRRSSSACARSGRRPRGGKRGRLIFALDATMSRQPTWDTACALQADMFREAAAAGGLDIQLVYFRGLGECRASGWVAQSERLAASDVGDRLPRRPHPNRQGTQPRAPGIQQDSGCRRWSSSATPWRRKSTICAQAAGELGLLGVPVFMFQEGSDPRRREGLSRDRAAVARRLLPFRYRRGA